MKILCYHGTSAEFLPSILTEGLKASADKVWNVSEDAVYCYSKNYLKDIQGSSIEESEDSFIRAITINSAREMKQISDAVLAKDVMTNIELAAKSGKYEYMWYTTATHDNLSIY